MSRYGTQIRRIAAAAFLLVASAISFSGSAAGQETLADLKDRMDAIRSELDATTVKIERLRTQSDELQSQIAGIEQDVERLEEKKRDLMSVAVARADELYRTGSIGVAEALFSSKDFGELADRAELLSQVSTEDSDVFVKLARTQAELDVLNEDLTEKQDALDATLGDLEKENERLQEQFHSVSSEYQSLRRRLTRQPEPTAPAAPSGGSTRPIQINVSGDMTCPVAGPVSFVDSWGAPRSGHTHQGVDMMADYGTPLVAITSGNITYAAYDGSGGNMIFLDGDDGNSYWYMHNQENLVTGGHVEVGQQIATVGDTGNAAGTPHLHFEFHPGGGSAINPYPLVSSLC